MRRRSARAWPSSKAARRRPPRATAAWRRWRERLIGDDEALTAFAAEHPGADLQALRALIRNARKEASRRQAAARLSRAVPVAQRRLNLQPLFKAEITLAPPQELGDTPQGRRRIIGITGGRFSGERLSGRVLPGGADWQVIRADGVADLDARYTLETARWRADLREQSRATATVRPT